MHRTLLAAMVLHASVLGAQFQSFDRIDRPDLIGKVVIGNLAIGGATAAVRAWMGGRNIPKAFVGGAVGGAVHVSGKMLSVGGGTLNPIGGMLVSSVGASMTANAGAGSGAFDELFVPLSVLRLRVTPKADAPVKVSVALMDVVMLADALHYDELTLDWKRTARAATFVFTTPTDIIPRSGQSVGGVALGNVIVLSTTFPDDAVHTLRHEQVHVQQYYAAQELWGRPIDGFLKRRSKLLRLVPSWLELSFGEALIYYADYKAYGERGPWRRSIESEAGALTR